MRRGAVGKVYKDGEIIVQQGDEGNCMYVVQAGKVEVVKEEQGQKISLGVLSKGEFFGEMALFERERRSATILAQGEARVLTIDKKTLLRRIQEDPTLAFRLLENLSKRIRELNARLVRATTK